MADGHIIKNFEELATTALRRDALMIAEAGFEGVDTARALEEMVHFEDGRLCIGGKICTVEVPERIFFIAVGKCAAASATTIERLLGDRLTRGIVLDVSHSVMCKDLRLEKIECFMGTHPTPSQSNVDATHQILALLSDLTPRDAVIVLVSGGGSTLLCQPPAGMTCNDEADLFKELTHRGASIQELNTVRKHLSLARGGNLARAAYPAQVIGLIFSDVPGNSMEFIASGPTVRDTTTIEDARAALARYGISHESLPLLETPKEDTYFDHVQNILVVDNTRGLHAMKRKSEELGYTAHIVTDAISGEARDVAGRIAGELHAAEPKTALLYGGETVVTIEDASRADGGRNQELAIAALQHIREGEIIAPFDSDGRDNSDYGGGIADQVTLSHAQEKHASIDEALASHASYTFFSKTGDAIVTGETGSNVSDLLVALKS